MKRFYKFIGAAIIIALTITVTTGSAVAQEKKWPLGGDSIETLAKFIKDGFYLNTSSLTLTASYLKGISLEAEKLGIKNPVAGIKPSENLKALTVKVDKTLVRAGIDQHKIYKLIRSGASEMITNLSDSGCKFYVSGKYRKSLREMGYNKGGCGFFADQKPDENGRFVIIETLQDFPAEKKGVRTGDRIVEVDGKPVKGMTFYNLADIVRGPVGSNVIITVVRQGRYLAIPIRRTWLGPNPNSLRYSILDGSRAGYVKFRFLGNRINFNLMDADKIFDKDKAEGLIWDFRNSAGSMEGALELAAAFVPAGKPFVQKIYRDSQDTFTGTGNPTVKKPGVIIVNRYTDPSCALAALILNRYAGVPLVGEPMEWECDLTRTHRMDDGSVAAIIYGYYRIPGIGDLENGDKVKPEFIVNQPPIPPYDVDGDQQLKKAQEILKQRDKTN